MYKNPFSIKEMKRFSQVKEFFLDEYNYYLNEREKIAKDIYFALNHKVKSYKFKNWVRLVSAKYANNPLSCVGSVKNATGGRFNVGNINKDRFPIFPALYIGNEKRTCIEEIYSGMEGFLDNKKSESFVQINGHIHYVLDLTKKSTLSMFVKVIKKISLSKSLKDKTKKLKLETGSIQNITQLKKTLYDINWRREPNLYDLPASSQIFGQLVKNAGIEAILYQSTKNSKKGLCLAIFPENFENSDSYVELDHPPQYVINKRMDSKTFQTFY